ncbi:spermidine synthase [Subtercola sp. YIM 133946]|uniref:spermidine synthase n=1 Tax=Subtercola sp. YIM 133946 TaxID=3118909 RepID=UPI002F930FF7
MPRPRTAAAPASPGLVFTMAVGPRAEQRADLVCIDAVTQEYVLSVDGIPQSRVFLSDPTSLAFGYIRQVARVIDAWAPAGHPLAVVHLGAGALTLPRYVAATRATSRQVVVEVERALCEAVLEALPLCEPLRLVYGDARAVAESAVAGWSGGDARAVAESAVAGWSDAEVTVVDLWSGAFIASRVAGLEFYRLVGARSAATGVVAVNLLDGPGFVYTKGQVAALSHVFAYVAVVLDERMLDNTQMGNVLVLASDAALGRALHAVSLAGGVRVLDAAELAGWVGDVPAADDAQACDSPPPDESHFERFFGRDFFAP